MAASGASFDITFDVATDLSASVTSAFGSPVNASNSLLFSTWLCGRVFDDFALALLGKNPVCLYPSRTVLRVLFGTSPALAPNTVLQMRAGFVRTADGQSALNGALQAIFVVPPPLPKPVASLQSRGQPSACEGVTLDGSASSGGAGRALTYRWLLTSAVGTRAGSLNLTAVQVLAYNTFLATFTGPVINLPADKFLIADSFVFALQVTNWLDQQSSATLVITKTPVAAGAVPVVSVLGKSARTA